MQGTEERPFSFWDFIKEWHGAMRDKPAQVELSNTPLALWPLLRHSLTFWTKLDDLSLNFVLSVSEEILCKKTPLFEWELKG